MKKWLIGGGGLVTVVLLFFYLFYAITSGPGQSESEWSPAVIVTAHKASPRVPGKDGMHVVWKGDGLTIHCVYADGHEGIVGNTARPCSDGLIAASYATSEVATLAAYHYAAKGED